MTQEYGLPQCGYFLLLKIQKLSCFSSFFTGGAKNYECQYLSDLDRGFVTNYSLSALSIEGADLKPPLDVVVEYSATSPALPASLNHSGVLSPLNAPSKGSRSPSSTLTTGHSSLLEGKSSTPYERVHFQKPILVSSLNLSCIDLTASHPSWEVSRISPSVESPKMNLESSKLGLIWSPSYPSVPPTLAEISSLIWSGTPLGKSALEEYPRSCSEPTFQDSNLGQADLAEEQQKSLSRNLAI